MTFDELLADGWVEIYANDIGADWVGQVRRAGGDVDARLVLSILLLLPDTEAVLHVEEADDEQLHQFVPRTRVFFQRPRAAEIGWDAATAAAVYAAIGSGSLTSAVTIAQRALRTFKVLDEVEMDVVIVIRALCGDQDPEITSVTAQALADVYTETTVDVYEVLDRLQSKGVVARTDTGWRLVS